MKSLIISCIGFFLLSFIIGFEIGSKMYIKKTTTFNMQYGNMKRSIILHTSVYNCSGEIKLTTKLFYVNNEKEDITYIMCDER